MAVARLLDGAAYDYFMHRRSCAVQVNSPIVDHLDPNAPDSLSLLIRYQGPPMVLAYKDWAKPAEPPKPSVKLRLTTAPDIRVRPLRAPKQPQSNAQIHPVRRAFRSARTLGSA
jgi:hypothetical protein